jgi:hypothetical protein
MVRMKEDCRLSTGLPPQQTTPSVVKPERESCRKRETGTGKLCEIKWDNHNVGTRARPASDEATMINHIRVTKCSETTLTGEYWSHISPTQGF